MSSTFSVPRITKIRRRHRSSRKNQRYFSSTNTSRTNIITPTKTPPTNDNKTSSTDKSNTVKSSYSVIKVHRCQHSAPETQDHKKCENAEWTIAQDISLEISSDVRKRSSATPKCQMSANLSNAELRNDHSDISFSAWSSRKLSSGNIYDKTERKKTYKRRSGFYCRCSPMCLCLCVFAGLLIAMAITALLVSLLMKSNTTTTTSTSTISTSRSSVFNVNLITNGDAETGLCDMHENVMQPTGWDYNGTITQIYYNTTLPSGQTFASPGPNDRGQCYFTGQISASTTMWQIIDLNNYVDSFFIDSQVVNYNLSAWLGGFSNQDDNVIVSLFFANSSNQAIGSGVSIGPILAIDRASQTSLLFCQTNGLVPAGTRFLTVLVTITRSSGPRNNGDVDNIAVVLY